MKNFIKVFLQSLFIGIIICAIIMPNKMLSMFL